MTSVEEQLPALLRKAAPMSVGVDVAEVLRLGRNVQRRRRLANVASVVIVSVGVGSLATVIASSGHPQNATVSPRPVTGAPVITTLTPASASPSAADLRADAAVLTRRLTASGFSGQVHVGVGYIALNLPSSAAGSRRAGTDQVQCRGKQLRVCLRTSVGQSAAVHFREAVRELPEVRHRRGSTGGRRTGYKLDRRVRHHRHDRVRALPAAAGRRCGRQRRCLYPDRHRRHKYRQLDRLCELHPVGAERMGRSDRRNLIGARMPGQ
jgi:hypothetical protein